MAVRRFKAIADATITNVFLEDLKTRATGSNTGLADSLEVFSIYGRTSSSFGSGKSAELSRALIRFPILTTEDSENSVQAKRTAGEIPASGNVSFYFKLYNVAHHETLPRTPKFNVFAVSSSWQEGRGVDLDTYTDKTYDNDGVTWTNASASYQWSKAGGDYHTGSVAADLNSIIMYSQTLEEGDENIEVDITHLVERWLRAPDASNEDKGYFNNGIGVFLTSSQEAYFSSSTGADLARVPPDSGDDLSSLSGGILHNLEGDRRSYYTKKFSARSSEYFFSRPVIEARWDDSIRDDRGSFYYSSSLAAPSENLNTLYFYNYYRGQLRNLPDVEQGLIYVSFFSGNIDDKAPSTSSLVLVRDGTHCKHTNLQVVTGGWVPGTTGIYSASVCMTGSSSIGEIETVYDVWWWRPDGATGNHVSQSAARHFWTGSISPKGKIVPSYSVPYTQYISSITNLKTVYSRDEKARFRVYTRLKDWNPTIYTKAVAYPEVDIVESGSYEIYRIIDDLEVIPHGTGSDMHTRMSFDASGSYFDLDIGMFEPGYMYGIRLAYYNNHVGSWVTQPDKFKFRVEE
tara:strand:+ start:1224 stop:2939 length:1716 start_codon:yes stop_codon:yes gene_type:complete